MNDKQKPDLSPKHKLCITRNMSYIKQIEQQKIAERLQK